MYTDSGGTGSQGRHDAKPDEEPTKEETPDDGITIDATGRIHLDLSA